MFLNTSVGPTWVADQTSGIVISGSLDNMAKHGKANALNQRHLGVYEIGYTAYPLSGYVFHTSFSKKASRIFKATNKNV